MLLNIRTGITFMVTASAYYVLERIFGLGEDVITGQVTLNVIPINVLDAVFISVALIGIAIVVYDKAIMHGKARREASVDVFSPTGLDRLDKLLQDTKERIYILGITLEHIHQYDSYFENAIKRGRRIRLALLNPESERLQEVQNLVRTTGLRDEIQRTLDAIRGLALTPEERKRLEVQQYDLLPTCGFILKDDHLKS